MGQLRAWGLSGEIDSFPKRRKETVKKSKVHQARVQGGQSLPDPSMFTGARLRLRADWGTKRGGGTC